MKRYGGNRMELNSVLQTITNVGFPIVACFYLSQHIIKIEKEQQTLLTELKLAITEMRSTIESLKGSERNER